MLQAINPGKKLIIDSNHNRILLILKKTCFNIRYISKPIETVTMQPEVLAYKPGSIKLIKTNTKTDITNHV